MLAMGTNELFHIPATAFSLVGNAFFWLAWQLKALPVYTLAAKIVPIGIEATLMSIISATNDLGGTAAKYLAAYMTDYFKVDEIAGSSCVDDGGGSSSPCINFENLYMLYAAQALLTVVPVIFVPLVPSERKISEVVAAVDDYTAAEMGGDEAVLMGASRASRAAAAAAAGASTFSPNSLGSNQSAGDGGSTTAPLLVAAQPPGGGGGGGGSE